MRFLLAFVLCFVAVAAHGDTNVYARRVNISSAQIDADEMARTGILRHCGRNGGRREGIGFSTAVSHRGESGGVVAGSSRLVRRDPLRVMGGVPGWRIACRQPGFLSGES